MRGTLHSLTLRGRCLVAAGATAALCGLILSERDLTRAGIVLLVVPLLSAIFVARTRFRLTCTRRLDGARVETGQRAKIVVRLENVSRLPTGLMLIEDSIPYLLGGRPRLVVDRLPPRRPVDVAYHVTGELRGRYSIGPLTVRLSDPFGLCEVARSFTTVDTLVVTPQIWTLPQVRLTGEWAGAGYSTARSVATHGDDDAATREYRHGDDLRRIHWRTTARRGQLTVRREEQPWQSRAAVLLDTRSIAHRGEGASSSFEAAISAAASVSLRLARSGFGVRMVSDAGRDLAADDLAPSGATTRSFGTAMLDALAVLTPSGGRNVRAGVSALQRYGTEGLVVAVVGELSPDDVEQLARLRRGRASVGLALVLNSSSWVVEAARATGAPTYSGEQAAAALGQAGWRTLAINRGDDLADVWSRVGVSVESAASHTLVTSTPTPAGTVQQ